jgi:hypothetical protein
MRLETSSSGRHAAHLSSPDTKASRSNTRRSRAQRGTRPTFQSLLFPPKSNGSQAAARNEASRKLARPLIHVWPELNKCVAGPSRQRQQAILPDTGDPHVGPCNCTPIKSVTCSLVKSVTVSRSKKFIPLYYIEFVLCSFEVLQVTPTHAWGVLSLSALTVACNISLK